MTTLRDLDQELEAIQSIMNDPNVDLESMEQGLNALNIERTAKLKNCGLFILELQSDVDAIYREIERLREKALKPREGKLDFLKGYVAGSMSKHGEKKISDPIVTLTCQKPPPSVHVVDYGEVPEEYWRHPEPPQPSVDKLKVARDLKAGKAVPGCELRTGDHYLKVT